MSATPYNLIPVILDSANDEIAELETREGYHLPGPACSNRIYMPAQTLRREKNLI
jgi:hypothetical protein